MRQVIPRSYNQRSFGSTDLRATCEEPMVERPIDLRSHEYEALRDRLSPSPEIAPPRSALAERGPTADRVLELCESPREPQKNYAH
jgi:hypothetical protein